MRGGECDLDPAQFLGGWCWLHVEAAHSLATGSIPVTSIGAVAQFGRAGPCSGPRRGFESRPLHDMT